jgi:hypothetical protein
MIPKTLPDDMDVPGSWSTFVTFVTEVSESPVMAHASSSTIESIGNPSAISSSALSSGIKAGIGVGCIAVFVLIIVVVLLLVRHRHRRRNARKRNQILVSNLKFRHDIAEKDGDARAELVASKLYPSHELKGSPSGEFARAELMASTLYPLHELRGGESEQVVELEGTGGEVLHGSQSTENHGFEDSQFEIRSAGNLHAYVSSTRLAPNPVTSDVDRSRMCSSGVRVVGAGGGSDSGTEGKAISDEFAMT